MFKKILLGLALSLFPLTAHANEKQVQCLAQNAYHEARGQGNAGMEAVTSVVLNRVHDPRFPKTPCAVIHQRTKQSCQFSWVCSNRTIRDKQAYQQALASVRRVYYNEVADRTGGAVYFHERSWRGGKKLKLTARIGDHSFYRG